MIELLMGKLVGVVVFAILIYMAVRVIVGVLERRK